MRTLPAAAVESRRRSIMADQRSGGSIQKMEALNQRRSAMDRALSDAGCM